MSTVSYKVVDRGWGGGKRGMVLVMIMDYIKNREARWNAGVIKVFCNMIIHYIHVYIV